MKKVFVVVALLFSLFSSVTVSHCYAYDWYWLQSNDDTSYYVDRSCGIWDKLDLHVMLKTEHINGEYEIISFIARYNSKGEISFLNEVVYLYDKNGHYNGHFSDKEHWFKIKPHSFGWSLGWKLFKLYEGNIERDNHIPPR